MEVLPIYNDVTDTNFDMSSLGKVLVSKYTDLPEHCYSGIYAALSVWLLSSVNNGPDHP